MAPDNSLILSSASKPVIFRAAKGTTQAKVFVGASADGATVSFLGVLADASTNTLWVGDRCKDKAIALPMPK